MTSRPSPARSRHLRVAPVLLRVAGVALLVAWWSNHQPAWLIALLFAVRLLSLRPTRAMLRYLLALAGMALIRGYVVKNVRPNAGQLPDPGRLADPDAAWRQWLDARCRTCGA